jgi:hypothetical protein
LLEDHGEDGDKDSLAEGSVGEEGGVVVESKLEVVAEASGLELRELCSRSVDFEHVLGLDFEEFELYDLAVLGCSSEVGENVQSFVFTVVGYEPARTMTCQYTGSFHRLWKVSPLRKPHDTNTKDDSRGKLNTNRNQPCSIGLGITSATDVVGAVS